MPYNPNPRWTWAEESLCGENSVCNLDGYTCHFTPRIELGCAILSPPISLPYLPSLTFSRPRRRRDTWYGQVPGQHINDRLLVTYNASLNTQTLPASSTVGTGASQKCLSASNWINPTPISQIWIWSPERWFWTYLERRTYLQLL